MSYNLTEDAKEYFDKEFDSLLSLLKTLTLIPAPSGEESARAEFVKNWLDGIGAEGAYIDQAKNVILRIAGEDSSRTVVFMAHTDTVFPTDTPLVWREDEEKLYAPGVGDDTCSLAVMLTVVKYIVKNRILPRCNILFVANACEEGLGNLRGSRKIIEDFGGEISEFYSFDSKIGSTTVRCVGSHRYKVTCTCEGGHSYGAFGKTNAIVELARLIGELYTVEIPKKEGTKTTYNVGTVSGGTSVNTIAQFAEMLYEYRSDDRECLAAMKAAFEEKLEKIKSESAASFEVECVGERPCDGDFDRAAQRKMIDRVNEISKRYTGEECLEKAGSTDCNSASSAGIPAICVGVYTGGGTHTREEWVVRDSIPTGLRICAELILGYFTV